MGKWIVKFKLLDRRGVSEQHFDTEEDANEFIVWCERNPQLISSAYKKGLPRRMRSPNMTATSPLRKEKK